MKTNKYLVPMLTTVLAIAAPAWADEPARPAAENASETGKNEIPVCKKLVPISVALGTEYPEKDRVEVVNKYEVPKRIEYAIACELEREGYSAAKPFDIKVSITNFRLRSGGTAIIIGLMAGVDKLGVNVDVGSADQTSPLRFDASTHTTKGGINLPTPTQRLNLMVQKIAKTVVEKIKKQGLLKDV